MLQCVSEQERALQEQAELDLRKQEQIRVNRQKAAVFLKQTLKRYCITCRHIFSTVTIFSYPDTNLLLC